MEGHYGVQYSDSGISMPELDAEHHESMGVGHLRLHLSDPADHLPYDVRFHSAAAGDGSQHQATAQSNAEETVQGPRLHRGLHGAKRQPEQPQPGPNLAVAQSSHQARS